MERDELTPFETMIAANIFVNYLKDTDLVALYGKKGLAKMAWEDSKLFMSEKGSEDE